MNNIVMPKDISIEAEILGAIIVDNNVILDVVEKLQPNDFYYEPHKYIYKAILSLYKQDKAIDNITLATTLKPVLDQIGGISYLAKLSAGGINYNVKEYCEIIKEYSKKRNILYSAQKMINDVSKDKMKANDIINDFESKMLVERDDDSKIITASQLASNTLEFIENNYNNGGNIIGMQSGLKTLDNWIDGFQKKNLYVIAARPSLGKTLFSLVIAKGLAKKSKGLLFEMEMANEDLGVRMLASETNMSGVKIRRGCLDENEWGKVSRGANSIANRNLFIDDTCSQTIYDIKAKAKKMKLQYDIDFIVIDHIGLIKESKPNMTRNDHIGEVSWQCKIMAKELDINVIILSQLSRAVEQRPDKRPIMSDLRESGNLEQNADTVMFLYRDDYYDPETEDKNIMEVLVSKQRNGKVGGIKLFCDLQSQIIADLARI